MKLLLLGNLRPVNSTENDWRHAFEAIGWEVDTVQEDDWINRRAAVPSPDGYDLMLWVRTWAAPADLVESSLAPWKGRIVAAHLDRWFGLHANGRNTLVYTDPYWRRIDWWFTADPQLEWWAAAGVRAYWMPPAVSDRWPLTAEPAPQRWAGDIVFVGNADRSSYHPEHTHRFAMLDQLKARYGRRFTVLPGPRPRIIGEELAEIYATYPIVIGDSALVGLDPYWSDRVPEVIGRGGYLIHPDTHWRGQFESGVHLDTFLPGDWQTMFARIDHALQHPDYRGRISTEGKAHVLAEHLYRHRAAEICEVVL